MGMKNYISGDSIDIARSGFAFHASAYFTVLQSATNYFQIKTSSVEDVTVLGYTFITNTQPMRFTALENPTVTDGTVAVPGINLNRRSTHVASTLLYSNPTSISGGTTLVDFLTPAGGNKAGGVIDGAEIWTLKKSSSYIVKIQNIGNNDSVCTFNMTWLES